MDSESRKQMQEAYELRTKTKYTPSQFEVAKFLATQGDVPQSEDFKLTGPEYYQRIRIREFIRKEKPEKLKEMKERYLEAKERYDKVHERYDEGKKRYDEGVTLRKKATEVEKDEEYEDLGSFWNVG